MNHPVDCKLAPSLQLTGDPRALGKRLILLLVSIGFRSSRWWQRRGHLSLVATLSIVWRSTPVHRSVWRRHPYVSHRPCAGKTLSTSPLSLLAASRWVAAPKPHVFCGRYMAISRPHAAQAAYAPTWYITWSVKCLIVGRTSIVCRSQVLRGSSRHPLYADHASARTGSLRSIAGIFSRPHFLFPYPNPKYDDKLSSFLDRYSPLNYPSAILQFLRKIKAFYQSIKSLNMSRNMT
ncbi:unnamed protein product [Arabidopsis halleri]